jgi:hypothetical protein
MKNLMNKVNNIKTAITDRVSMAYIKVAEAGYRANMALNNDNGDGFVDTASASVRA